jgi:FKBP-type peptidyl-prolyl cis-trans isomerase
VGQGAEATGTKAALLHYALWLYDPVGPDGKGRLVDSSRSRGQTYAFRLGTNSVIPGFEQGVTGMRVGGMRRVTVPPTLGYGSAGSLPNIPGNAWLVFELELLDVAD